MAGERSIRAPAQTLTLLPQVLRAYADAAHPPGGSPCSQAAREHLLDLAGRLEQALQQGTEVLHYPRRMRATLHAAVQWRLEQTTDPQQAAGLEQLLRAIDGESQ
ncbi:MAG: hypothetical protein D6717_06500 [Gammaproteobacteria bacterium]|nr:MAG: hypothetical protein D6717_06500 [Gammaproteobacteria bacterium]